MDHVPYRPGGEARSVCAGWRGPIRERIQMYQEAVYIKPTHGEGLVKPEQIGEAEALIEAIRRVPDSGPCPEMALTPIGIEVRTTAAMKLHERIVRSGRNREGMSEWDVA